MYKILQNFKLSTFIITLMILCMILWASHSTAQERTTSSRISGSQQLFNAEEEPIIIENHQELLIRDNKQFLYLTDHQDNIKYVVMKNRIVAIQNIRPHNDKEICRVYLGIQYIDFIGEFHILQNAFISE